MAEFDEELAFANELADRAGRIGIEVFGGDFEVRRKADLTPVTEADLRIEAMVRERLAERFPADAVLGEEQGLQGPAGAARTWIVDPIDGTKNFAAGIQIWGTLIALTVDGEAVLGVAGAPGLGERYEAVRRGGARLNGEPIRVSGVAELSEALLCSTGVHPFVRGPWERAYLALADQVYRTRGFGDFWGHMLVARGSADAMVEERLRVWDWAAVKVIVEEAGGTMTQIDGSPVADGGSVLTSNGALHAALVDRFAG